MGCNSVSYPFGKGNASALKVLLNSDYLELEVFGESNAMIRYFANWMPVVHLSVQCKRRDNDEFSPIQEVECAQHQIMTNGQKSWICI